MGRISRRWGTRLRLAAAAVVVVGAGTLIGTPTVHAANLTITGTLTTDNPQYPIGRPDQASCAAVIDDLLPTKYVYELMTLTVSADGDYTYTDNRSVGGLIDIEVAVYDGPFDAGAPLDNCLASLDDINVIALTAGTYTLAVTSYDEPTTGAYSFTFDGPGEVTAATTVAVDVATFGGPPDAAFGVELLQGAGSLASATETAPNSDCSAPALAECAVLQVPLPLATDDPVGLVTTAPPGWSTPTITCDRTADLGALTGAGLAENDHDGTDLLAAGGDTYCVVTYVWEGGHVTIDAAVVNDDGGTATATAVQAEVYDSTDTLIAGPTACAADGSCLELDLPPGDYTVGYVGPAGYTLDVTQSTTNQGPLQQTQAIVSGDPQAAFTIASGDQVDITLTIDDPEPLPTTTTTTTTTPTTTTTIPAGAPPTTPPATTAAPTIAPILPETGTTGRTTGAIAAIAATSVLAGVALTRVRRRPI